MRWDGKVRDAYVNENGFTDCNQLNSTAMGLLHGPLAGSTIVGNLVIWIPNPQK